MNQYWQSNSRRNTMAPCTHEVDITEKQSFLYVFASGGSHLQSAIARSSSTHKRMKSYVNEI